MRSVNAKKTDGGLPGVGPGSNGLQPGGRPVKIIDPPPRLLPSFKHPLIRLPRPRLPPTVPLSPALTLPSIPPRPQPISVKPVSKEDWTTGPGDAAVTLVEYSDFQCPACAALAAILGQILKDYPQSVQVVFRYFPNPLNDKGLLSAQAVEAAGLQGKFWEMSGLLFTQQSTWTQMSAADFETWVDGQAAGLKLDPDRFKSDMHSDEVVTKLTAAQKEDESLSLPGPPLMLVNGKIYQAPRDLESLETTINLLLLANKQVLGCPPMTIDVTRQYLAHLVTDKGEIVIQLFADQAPFTVNSFVFLANRGWFDGITFHWVVAGQFAQTGDPSGTGYGVQVMLLKMRSALTLNLIRPG